MNKPVTVLVLVYVVLAALGIFAYEKHNRVSIMAPDSAPSSGLVGSASPPETAPEANEIHAGGGGGGATPLSMQPVVPNSTYSTYPVCNPAVLPSSATTSTALYVCSGPAPPSGTGTVVLSYPPSE